MFAAFRQWLSQRRRARAAEREAEQHWEQVHRAIEQMALAKIERTTRVMGQALKEARRRDEAAAAAARVRDIARQARRHDDERRHFMGSDKGRALLDEPGIRHGLPGQWEEHRRQRIQRDEPPTSSGG